MHNSNSKRTNNLQVEHWGLWWLPSFINHSCLPSSSPILVGRALFIFASRDLRAGDEVTRSYFDIFQPLEQRRELSTKGWGFVCHCPRCKLEDALHVPLSRVTKRYTKLVSSSISKVNSSLCQFVCHLLTRRCSLLLCSLILLRNRATSIMRFPL